MCPNMYWNINYNIPPAAFRIKAFIPGSEIHTGSIYSVTRGISPCENAQIERNAISNKQKINACTGKVGLS